MCMCVSCEFVIAVRMPNTFVAVPFTCRGPIVIYMSVVVIYTVFVYCVCVGNIHLSLRTCIRAPVLYAMHARPLPSRSAEISVSSCGGGGFVVNGRSRKAIAWGRSLHPNPIGTRRLMNADIIIMLENSIGMQLCDQNMQV